MSKQCVEVLGVPVDCLSEEEAVAHILSLATGDTQHHIATPNPEMLVAARKDASFLDVLRHTSLNLPDGTGLVWAARRRGGKLPGRVTGTDVMRRVCTHPSCGPVFLLGAAPGVAQEAAEALRRTASHLTVAGTYAGSDSTQEEEEIFERIRASGATILFVAFGAPRQEKWIARALPHMPNVRVAMGVGGAFDFLAGRRKRAPAFLRKTGLEWAWRLLLEPRRIKRIWNAVVVFPFLVLFFSARKPRS